MNKKVLHTLEYNKIIDQLIGYAVSDPGKEVCRRLKPSSDLEQIERDQQQTADAFARILRNGTLVCSGLANLGPSRKRLEVGGSLSAHELLLIRDQLQLARRAIAYDGASRGDRLKDALTPAFTILDDVAPLRAEIERCILSEDEISDDASPALRKIRREMGLTGERIRAQMNKLMNSAGVQNYLQDHVIAMRGDHYCLPVKAEYRSQIPGIIHDQSSTGSTIFIEPAAVVQLNNRFQELVLEEQEEIEKILAELSEMASQYLDVLESNQSALTHLDFVFAKGQLAESMNGSKPVYNTEHRIHLRKARHPLLDKQKVVPVTIPLGEDYEQLIITGPNTGGKTVSLKTVGLLTLMGQAGLHIPAAERSQLSVFTQVYADIGDEQSIEQSLSTFSSHMKNIVYILRHADADSLVLFDELCAGTDPTEGAALAIAILSKLRQSMIRTMATTHYSELKVYALSTPQVENASCEFNVESLSPTYRLLIGIPGKSNAFAISQKLGLSTQIIDDAKMRMEEEDETFEDLISDLESRKRKIEDQQIETEKLNKEAKSLRHSLDQKLEKNDEMRERILEEAKAQAAKILQEAKDQADASIRAINKYGSSTDAVARLEQERTKLRNELKKNTKKKAPKAAPKPGNAPDPKKLRIGDYVKVVSLNTKGTVHTLPDAKGNLTVQMGILKSRVNVRDLVLLDEPTATPKAKKSYSGTSARISKAYSISPEVNLIGMNADDAIAELDKYLDDAYLANLASARIVHGKGSGILRKAVQNHLKSLPYVKGYQQGEYGEGDSGVTIVKFDHDT